ncbi:hypothetical protein ACFYWX_36990 [Streptomyces sp. NPDC002888]|uniref:hypothetical protein n=1 Tax=Streptomyces sp. NPDC002888 TaxID=3364668 RepID=UPI0036B86B31
MNGGATEDGEGLSRAGVPARTGEWDAGAEGVVVEETAVSETAVSETAVRETAVSEMAVRETAVRKAGVVASEVGVSEATPARKPDVGSSRRGAVDPVKALMHRHRELCERAVDPLEIAAGLEAHGVTDRTAARFRHRDVFSLAEEMYARIPRDGETPPCPPAPAAARPRVGRALLTLLPGALCAATIAGVRLTQGQSRLIVAAAGVLAVALGLRAALRRGPLGPRQGTYAGRRASGVWTCWLLAYAALGDGLLRAALAGGPDGLPTSVPDGPWPLATVPTAALTLACAPAAWTTHLFAVRARRKLAASRGLEEFATSVRPLLFGTFALYLGALTVLLALCAAVLDEPASYTSVLTLGALLLLARLLAVHGFAHAPAVVLAATVTAEAVALASVFASRLPGCAALAVPVETLVEVWGPVGVPALACGAATLTLLIHAARTLTRASAHAHADRPW